MMKGKIEKALDYFAPSMHDTLHIEPYTVSYLLIVVFASLSLFCVWAAEKTINASTNYYLLDHFIFGF